MKVLYCDIQLGKLAQNIILIDTEAPSNTFLEAVSIDELAQALFDYKEAASHICLGGSPVFNKKIVERIKELDTQDEIRFIDL